MLAANAGWGGCCGGAGETARLMGTCLVGDCDVGVAVLLVREEPVVRVEVYEPRPVGWP